jgi:hypothetical protein
MCEEVTTEPSTTLRRVDEEVSAHPVQVVLARDLEGTDRHRT